MDLIQIIKANEDKNYHLGRIIILLREFCGKSGDKPLNGITKFVKLDFLLRYPLYLEKAISTKSIIEKEKVNVKTYERYSIESKMVRYKYGPWDFKYRQYINILVGKGLIILSMEGKKINFYLTPRGIELADKIKEEKAFIDIANRSKLLKKYFNINGTSLKDFIYNTFPEIINLNYGEDINNEHKF